MIVVVVVVILLGKWNRCSMSCDVLAEVEGIWFTYTDESWILLRRFPRTGTRSSTSTWFVPGMSQINVIHLSQIDSETFIFIAPFYTECFRWYHNTRHLYQNSVINTMIWQFPLSIPSLQDESYCVSSRSKIKTVQWDLQEWKGLYDLQYIKKCTPGFVAFDSNFPTHIRTSLLLPTTYIYSSLV